MQKLTVATRLEKETLAELKALAEKDDRKVAYLVRKAVEQFVEEQQKSRRPAA